MMNHRYLVFANCGVGYWGWDTFVSSGDDLESAMDECDSCLPENESAHVVDLETLKVIYSKSID